nr:endoplasmic reticulum junction formation protein lunapark-like [Drosophila kikkawai]
MEQVMDKETYKALSCATETICKECFAHNGMLPKEEYEYASFRCAFCSALNQARKERPVAPRLSLEAPTPTKRNESSESESYDDESEKQAPVRRVLLQEVPSRMLDHLTKKDLRHSGDGLPQTSRTTLAFGKI